MKLLTLIIINLLTINVYAHTHLVNKHLIDFSREGPSISYLTYQKHIDNLNSLSGAIGYADLKFGIEATTKHSYCIGSVSKPLTAIIILRLEEKGVLDIDDEVKKYLPEVSAKITLHHLLSNTSGIAEVFNTEPFINRFTLPADRKAAYEFIVSLLNYDNAPGERYFYSNTNFILLSYIIEKVTQKTFAEVLEEEISLPLGMTGTYEGSSNQIKEMQASGYNAFPSSNITPANYLPFDLDWGHGAGSTYSTPKDLLKLFIALAENKLITEESKIKFLKNNRLNDGEYTNEAYGFSIRKINQVLTYTKSGSINGFQSNVFWVPSKDIVTIAMTNVFSMTPPSFVNKVGKEMLTND